MVTQKLISKNNKSVSYSISFIFIILVYIIFFNTKSFLPDDSEIQQTTLNKEINVGSTSTKIVLNRAEYNQNENFMEIEFNYTDNESLTNDFDFLAKVKTDTIKELEVKPIINTNNTCIVHVENIPKDYKVISLKVIKKSSEFDTSTSIDDDSKLKSVSLYFDYRKTEINNNLKVETEKNYMINIVKNQIATINKDIENINNEINKNNEFIDMTNKKISELNGQIKYQIEKEIVKTKQEIEGHKTKINERITSNQELETTKKLKLEKIKKLQEKLNDISQK